MKKNQFSYYKNVESDSTDDGYPLANLLKITDQLCGLRRFFSALKSYTQTNCRDNQTENTNTETNSFHESTSLHVSHIAPVNHTW